MLPRPGIEPETFRYLIKCLFWQIRSTWRYSFDTDLTKSAHSQTRYTDSFLASLDPRLFHSKTFTSEFSNSIYSSSCIGNLDRLLIYAEKNCKAALLLVMPILPRLFMPFYARASSTLKHASLKLNSWSRFSTMLSIRVQID